MQIKFFLYPWVWNNWKIPSVSFWITAKSSVKHVILCSQIQVPFRFISYSFIYLHCNSWHKYSFFEDHIYVFWSVYFNLACVWNCLIFRNCSFCFVLFFCENGLSDTRHWMSSRVGFWTLSLIFQVLSFLVLHSILENQKRIDCFSLTNRAFMFFQTFKLCFSCCNFASLFLLYNIICFF